MKKKINRRPVEVLLFQTRYEAAYEESFACLKSFLEHKTINVKITDIFLDEVQEAKECTVVDVEWRKIDHGSYGYDDWKTFIVYMGQGDDQAKRLIQVREGTTVIISEREDKQGYSIAIDGYLLGIPKYICIEVLNE